MDYSGGLKQVLYQLLAVMANEFVFSEKKSYLCKR